MGNNKKKWLLILFILSFSFVQFPLHAQNENDTPLLEILKKIEENFDVKFSFSQSDIDSIKLNQPDYQNTLENLLIYLNEQTSLNFRKIDDRYVVISSADITPFSICGKIIDAETLQPLAGATVQVFNSTLSTTTNAAGDFNLQIEQNNLIVEIRYLGFQNQNIAVDYFKTSSPCNVIYLSPSINVLQEVVLSDLFTKGISKSKDGSVKINVSNFAGLPGLTEPDILQMIQTLPGIISVDETISNISIRGGTTDENLILWDDIKMYQNGHFFGLISAFNPYLNNEVVVYKNGTPARYGESVSGVVAMQSDDNHVDNNEFGVQVNMINAGAFAKLKVIDNLSLQLSGRRTYTDLYESPAYKQMFNKVFQDTKITSAQNVSGATTLNTEEEFTFYDFSLKAIYTPNSKDQFSVNFLTIDNNLNFTETISSPSSQNSETSRLDQNNIAGGISWQRNWSENLTSKVLFYGSQYTLEASNQDIFSTQALFQSNKVLETGAKLDLNYKISPVYSLSGGYQFSETGISNTQEVNIPLFRNFIKEVLRAHAGYINNAFQIDATQTFIQAGLRLNYLPKFDEFFLEPRLNVHQKLGNGFAVEGSFEQKSQTVTQRIDFQSDFLGVEKRRWVLSNNEDVPIERSRQYTLGVLYQKAGWLLQLEGYSKEVNGITSANQGFQNQLQFTKTTGRYLTKGLEAIINRKTEQWSSWISYTYATNDYEFKTLIPSRFPHNYDIRHQATLATSYSLNRFKIAAAFNWHTGRPYTLASGQTVEENGVSYILHAPPNQARNSDYSRIDLSAEYEFSLGSNTTAKLNAAILNIANTKNVLNTYYVLKQNDNSDFEISKVEQVSLGITPNLSLQVFF